MGLDYKDAGVDVEAGYKSVKLMREHVKSTFRKEVLGDIGGFGGMFSLANLQMKEPILISGTDGVGTKLKLAFIQDKHTTVGIDSKLSDRPPPSTMLVSSAGWLPSDGIERVIAGAWG